MDEINNSRQKTNPATKDLPLASAIISAVFGFIGALSLMLLWTRVCARALAHQLGFYWCLIGSSLDLPVRLSR
jgi:multisubunit Na+/H+ antiporter MnhG subunit